MERRKHKRFFKKLMVMIGSGTLHSSGILSDVSRNGMFIRSDRDFTKDMVIDIELLLPDKKVSSLKGIVKRNTKIPGANWLFGSGIEIIEKDDTFHNFLHTLTSQT